MRMRMRAHLTAALVGIFYVQILSTISRLACLRFALARAGVGSDWKTVSSGHGVAMGW